MAWKDASYYISATFILNPNLRTRAIKTSPPPPALLWDIIIQAVPFRTAVQPAISELKMIQKQNTHKPSPTPKKLRENKKKKLLEK